MELGFSTLVLLPAGLGLLGFVEPCSIGGHLLFLNTQKPRSRAARLKAVLFFIIARVLVAGSFGALIALLGKALIGVQTGMWLVFGSIYLIIGLAFVMGRAGLVKKRIDFAPVNWKHAKNPVLLGLAFGLNIPACAAPILFGLLGLAATSGTALTGFFMMGLFGLFLSLPLVPFAIEPKYFGLLDWLADKIRHMGWIFGAIFVILGLWSIWFGLYFDPESWSGK